jgi:hypothetical protein
VPKAGKREGSLEVRVSSCGSVFLSPHIKELGKMNKRNTLQRVTDTVKDAAVALAHAADDHVVQPVGKALGLISKDEPKTKSEIKAARNIMAKPLGARQESKRKSKAARTMTGPIEKMNSKPNMPTNSGRGTTLRRGSSKGR